MRRRSFTRLPLALLAWFIVAVHGCDAFRPAIPPRRTASAPVVSSTRPSERSGVESSVHVALGLPRDADDSDDVLLDEHEFIVSYNPTRRVANWVSWKLDRADLGGEARHNDFRADPMLPAGLNRAMPADYAHEGFDRGHLCPSGDRTRTAYANEATFVMTNIHPQVRELNRGPWEELEVYERSLARGVPGTRGSSNEVYIVAGGIFGDAPQTIGRGIAVPLGEFKVIVVLHVGEGPKDVRESTPVVAVIMPNDVEVRDHPWEEFAVSVDEVERRSGYELLARVPEAVQESVESRVIAPSR